MFKNFENTKARPSSRITRIGHHKEAHRRQMEAVSLSCCGVSVSCWDFCIPQNDSSKGEGDFSFRFACNTFSSLMTLCGCAGEFDGKQTDLERDVRRCFDLSGLRHFWSREDTLAQWCLAVDSRINAMKLRGATSFCLSTTSPVHFSVLDDVLTLCVKTEKIYENGKLTFSVSYNANTAPP